MELEVLRFSSQVDSTNGLLFDITGGKRSFLCYTLEDEYRPMSEKVMGETRIPAGRYKCTLRTEGGFHAKYTKKYKDMHKGMIWVRDIPNFEWVLFHTGNTDESTAGCLIFGDTQQQNITLSKDGFVGSSVNAYKRVYPPIAEAIESGEEVWVTYVDYDYIENKEEIVPEMPETKVFDFSKVPEYSGKEYKLQSPMMNSDEVKQWQKEVGLDADGWYGKGSKVKAIELQKIYGLEANGILDTELWKFSFAGDYK
tara:strand:+ start:1483 stop:2244 length:762 start_codon:yes stop_codon:yes gene_type:complete